jgi:hypothetical protein
MAQRGRPPGIITGLYGSLVDPTKPFAVHAALRGTSAEQSLASCYRWTERRWYEAFSSRCEVASWSPCADAFSATSWSVDPRLAFCPPGTLLIEQKSLAVEATSYRAGVKMTGYLTRTSARRGAAFDPDVSCPTPNGSIRRTRFS